MWGNAFKPCCVWNISVMNVNCESDWIYYVFLTKTLAIGDLGIMVTTSVYSLGSPLVV
jgi:hypothetical protein